MSYDHLNKKFHRMTFGQAVEDFLIDRDGKSARTVEWYRDMLSHFCWWQQHFVETGTPDGTVLMHLLDHRIIKRFFAYMRQAHPAGRWGRALHNTTDVSSEGTIRAHGVAIQTLFSWAVEDGCVGVSPFVLHKDLLPRCEPSEVKPFTYTELEKLLEACEPDTWAGARDAAIIQMMASTGLRITELCNLRFGGEHDDYDPSSGEVRVIRGKRGKSRTVNAGREARKAIRKYLLHWRPQARQPYLFLTWEGNKLNRNSVAHVFQRLGDKAGIEVTRSHRLRHFAATELIKNHVPRDAVSRILGHASNSRMMDVYVNLSEQDLRELQRAGDPLDNMVAKRAKR